MSTAKERILEAVADEQEFLATIVSTLAAKSVVAATWAMFLPSNLMASPFNESPNTVLEKIVVLEDSISTELRAAADKEISIAAKLGAVLGTNFGSVKFSTCRESNCDC